MRVWWRRHLVRAGGCSATIGQLVSRAISRVAFTLPADSCGRSRPMHLAFVLLRSARLSDKHSSDNDMHRGAKDIFDVIAKMTVLLAAMSARHAADNARTER